MCILAPFKTYRKLKGSQLWVSHNIFFTFLSDNNTYNRSNHDHTKFIRIIKTYLGIQFDDKKEKTKQKIPHSLKSSNV